MSQNGEKPTPLNR